MEAGGAVGRGAAEVVASRVPSLEGENRRVAGRGGENSGGEGQADLPVLFSSLSDALHAARFSCLTLSLYHLEVGWFLYPLCCCCFSCH